MRKRIALILCLLLVLTLLPTGGFQSFADPTDEQPILSCGDRVTCVYNEETRTLEVTGTGDMYAYSGAQSGTQPWWSYRSKITFLKVHASVSGIGAAAFSDCTELKSVLFPATLKKIAQNAFLNCTALSDVYCLGTEQDFQALVIDGGSEAFDNCGAISDVQYIGTEGQSEEIVIAEGNESLQVMDWQVSPYLYGDADGNGSVAAAGAAAVLRHVVHLIELSQEMQAICDVSGNGNGLTAADAATILRYVVKLIGYLPQ